MSVVKTVLFPPALRESQLSKPEQRYLFTLQMIAPLNIVDTTLGPQVIPLPNPGLDNSQTGQSNQNSEWVYVKGSADGNSATITGAISGPVVLAAQFDFARFKSDATSWWRVG